MTDQDQPSERPTRRAHGLGRAALGIAAMVATGAWAGSRLRGIETRDRTLPPALAGERRTLRSLAGPLSYYVSGEDRPGTPLLLVHSINAAGSAYEVRPLYDHYAATRPVYALDLPGFGFSDRSDRAYTPRLMTDAVHAMAAEIGERHGPGPLNALALSLGAEFLARAASERPDPFRTLAFVSPTGFGGGTLRMGPPGSTRGIKAVRDFVHLKPIGKTLFDLLTTRTSIRYFLQKTWGSKQIDEDMLDYDYHTTHQPGAEFAVYHFLSGFLFSGDINRLYAALTLPIFVAHGTRGDFTDYRHLKGAAAKANWTISVFETGAFPQFEKTAAFVVAYDSFIATHLVAQPVVALP